MQHPLPFFSIIKNYPYLKSLVRLFMARLFLQEWAFMQLFNQDTLKNLKSWQHRTLSCKTLDEIERQKQDKKHAQHS